MAKMELIAINRIGIGKPDKNGQIGYVQPGERFEIEEETGKNLVAAKAARVPQTEGPKKADTTSPEELERLSLLEEAKAEGVKGLRANSSTETIKSKLEEHRAAQTKDGDGDGKADDGTDQEDLV